MLAVDYATAALGLPQTDFSDLAQRVIADVEAPPARVRSPAGPERRADRVLPAGRVVPQRVTVVGASGYRRCSASDSTPWRRQLAPAPAAPGWSREAALSNSGPGHEPAKRVHLCWWKPLERFAF